MTSDQRLRADQVLVTIGTACSVSALGTTETQRAAFTDAPELMGYAAYDAGLVHVELGAAGPRFVVAHGPDQGAPLDGAQISRRWGAELRAQRGIRALADEHEAGHASDLAATLPHDLEQGGLRRLAGLQYQDLRESSVRDMSGLFQDDPQLGPSLQAQLFVYGGIGALAALPVSLRELLPRAYDFRIAAGCAFSGHESFHRLLTQSAARAPAVKRKDTLAYRLAASLNTHGPALINALLAPAYHLSKVRRAPERLAELVCEDTGLCNVPQAPMVVSAACASALCALADIAPQLVTATAAAGPKLVLWTAADAALQPDFRVIDGFGRAALASRSKLSELNRGRTPAESRELSQVLAPFDRDACGTVIGHGGSGMLVTTLQFAVDHALDITSLIVGWGQSGETGGKGHFAGIGFGGENALLRALHLAHRAHGYGTSDFQHLVPHATGTRANSHTDLSVAERALQTAAAMQGAARYRGRMTVGAPKALGYGHTMGESGLRSAADAVYHLLGQATAGVSTLRALDPELGPCVEHFQLSPEPVRGNEDGGALIYAQGFGGYVGALALRAAHADALRRYDFAQGTDLSRYLERREELRRSREQREREFRSAQRGILRLLQEHHWPGLSGS